MFVRYRFTQAMRIARWPAAGLTLLLLCSACAESAGPVDSGARGDTGLSDRGPREDARPASDAGAEDLGAGLDAATELDAAGADALSGADGGEPDAAAPDAGAPLDAGPGADAADLPDAGPGADAQDLTDAGLGDAGLGPSCGPAAPGATEADRYHGLLACLRDPAPPEGVKRAAINAFVTAVEAGQGFPFRDGASYVFVYVRTSTWDVEDDRNTAEDFFADRRQEPIRLAGAHNAWSTTANPLSAEGYDFFHLALPIAQPARSGYKFVSRDGGGGDVWFSDPLSRRFDYDNNGRISLVLGGPAQGHLEWIRAVHATQLGNDRTVYLYLPPGYEGGTASYPVLYMHDGQNIFDAAQPSSAPASWDVDAVMEREIAAGHLSPGIIVGVPNNADRFSEYTHVPDDVGTGALGGAADDYADFLALDLKPLIDRRYRTSPGRATTGVLGSSLGGLVSFEIGLVYPTTFRFIGGLSSTFGWGRIGLSNETMVERYARTSSLAAADQVYYLDSGGGPGGGCASGGGADNYCETIAMRDLLVSRGIATFPDNPDQTPLTPAGIDILHWWEPSAPHNEAAWSARVHRALWLFFR